MTSTDASESNALVDDLLATGGEMGLKAAEVIADLVWRLDCAETYIAGAGHWTHFEEVGELVANRRQVDLLAPSATGPFSQNEGGTNGID